MARFANTGKILFAVMTVISIIKASIDYHVIVIPAAVDPLNSATLSVLNALTQPTLSVAQVIIGVVIVSYLISQFGGISFVRANDRNEAKEKQDESDAHRFIAEAAETTGRLKRYGTNFLRSSNSMGTRTRLRMGEVCSIG